MSDPPLVSCVMPTRDHRPFVAQSLWYFLRQDYPRKELIVLDDGDDDVRDLVPDDERIRYVRLDEHVSLGRKRNLGAELARGELIVHWDDDDWISPDRLQLQVEALTQADADVCGADRLLHYRLSAGEAWLRHLHSNGRPRLAGATLMYRRAAWQRAPFADLAVGEDADFLDRLRADRIHAIDDSSFYLAVLHRTNACAHNLADSSWEARPFDEVAARLQSDRGFYIALRNGSGDSAPASVEATTVTLTGMFMVWDGYGGMSEYLALGMARAGASVNVVALGLDEQGLSAELAAMLRASQPDPRAPVLWFAPPAGARERFPAASDVFVNTMWESDRLPPQWIEPLTCVRGVIVPTRFVASVCRREGIETPIEVVPEGVDPRLYHYVDRPERSGLTTLLVGPVVRRKHTHEAIAAWQRAFRGDPDARLVIKSKFGLRDDVPNDRRIRVVSDTERDRGILHWYRQADVLLALGNEGFGLPLVEGMATGLPVIALDSEGQGDICADAPDLVLPVPAARWEACDDTPWGVVGKRAIPSVKHVATQLRWVDTHREEARELGRAASSWALQHRNVWDKAPAVLDVMEQRMSRPRPLRRVTTMWVAGSAPETQAATRALADELPSVRLSDTHPALRTLRLLHVHHDDAGPNDAELSAYLLEAALAGIPVVLTEHVVGRELRVWERDADVLVAASPIAAERLRKRWPAKRVEVLPYGCPPPVSKSRSRRGRVLATVGTLEEDSPWRVLDALDSFRGASLLVLAPESTPERERAWAEASRGRAVKRLTTSSTSADAARVLATSADAAVFWEGDGPRLGSSLQIRVALASGVPTLASPIGRFADVSSATYQPGELEGGVEDVLGDDSLRTELAERARRYCEQHSWARMAQLHLDLWHSFETT